VDQARVSLMRWLRRQLRQPLPGREHLEAAVENNLADVLHAAGRPDDAMGHLKRAVALFAEVGGRPGELEPELWMLEAW